MREHGLSDNPYEKATPLSILREEVEALKHDVRKSDSKALDSLPCEVLNISRSSYNCFPEAV